MGTGSPRQSPEAPAVGVTSTAASSAPDTVTDSGGSDAQEVFSMIKKPRVRYDVEVVTKLIVYSGKSISGCSENADPHVPLSFSLGIAIIVTDCMAYVFDFLGLAP